MQNPVKHAAVPYHSHVQTLSTLRQCSFCCTMALGWLVKQHPSQNYSMGIIISFDSKSGAGEADSSILLL